MEVSDYKTQWEEGFRQAVAFYSYSEGSSIPTYKEWNSATAAFKDGWMTGLRAGKNNKCGGMN